MKLSELQQVLHKITPAAVLVSPQVLDRVIQQVNNLPAFPWDVPHRESYVVDRQDLFRHIEQEDLNLSPEHLLPSTVILLLRPSNDSLATATRDAVLGAYWRRLFHASIHLLLEQRWKDGQLKLDEIRRRIDEIGQSQFQEIRRVLTEERYLLDRAEDQTVYIEFAAVFLELRYFAANLLPIYFPSMRDTAAVEAILGRDLDAVALFNQTRLEGASNPVPATDTSSDESNDFYWKLIRGAERAADSGNTVRAAILRTRAARVAPANLTRSTRALAEGDMTHLAQRLKAALELSDAETQEWPTYLKNLLDKADQGTHPVEADLLFELQNVCLDAEQGIYALSLVDWALSMGRRAIKRELPYQRQVRSIKHLRSAALRLTQSRVSDGDRQQLGRLIQSALDQSEKRLRDSFRPALTAALEDVGLRPENPPERVAFSKIIDEVLDRIIDAGYLTFSDLRDVISRNQLKLPDLGDPQDLLRGDPLLRLDRRLGSLLDGVYRPSELYSRMLERLTALNFGTWLGRLLTTYITIPFGGAFLLIELVKILLDHIPGLRTHQPTPEQVTNLVGQTMGALGVAPASAPIGPLVESLAAAKVAESQAFAVVSWTAMLVQWGIFLAVGLYLLALWHSPRARALTLRVFLALGDLIHWLCVEVPTRLANLPSLNRFVASWPFQFFYWCLFKPLIIWTLLGLWLREYFFGSWMGMGLSFLFVTVIINSPPGRAAFELLNRSVLRLSEVVSASLFKGLFNLIVTLFKEIVSAVEGILFRVDEWLRFRTGENQVIAGVRMVLGLLWFPISYCIRFYIVVLIEPMLNPLKLPVTIIAAKFLLPFQPLLTLWATHALQPVLGYWVAFAISASTVWLLPDLFGYLFWELKENWALYRANRSPVVRPAVVGHHGETMLTLLQPGFHSGTIPRLFARWRRAERDAVQTGNWRTARYYRHALKQLEQTLRLFVQRNLVLLVHQSKAWPGEPLGVGRVQLSNAQVRVELVHANYPDRPVWLGFEEHQGWLVATIDSPGFLRDLPSSQVQPLNTSLVNLYKLANVGLVREQMESQLPPTVHDYDITSRELILWLDHRYGLAVPYSWYDDHGKLKPRRRAGPVPVEAPLLDAARFIFQRTPLYWQQWVECWDKDQTGLEHPRLVIGGVTLDLVDLVRANPGEELRPPVEPSPHDVDAAGVQGVEPSPYPVNGAVSQAAPERT